VNAQQLATASLATIRVVSLCFDRFDRFMSVRFIRIYLGLFYDALILAGDSCGV